MTTIPSDVPPYQLQTLIAYVVPQYEEQTGRRDSRAGIPRVVVTCAQSLGSEIYVGCSDGSLLRFALQADDPNSPESYKLLSSQQLPTSKPIDEIALAPSISRALILTGHQIHFYTLPSLDPVPIQPIRNVIHFSIDDHHMRKPPPSLADPHVQVEPIEFCVIKRTNVAMYSIRDKLFFQQEIPIPQGVRLARRSGGFLCIAGKELYSTIDLRAASLVDVMPINQAFDDPGAVVKPSITVISDGEFLILSSMGATTMGVFMTGAGDPVRGTLQFPSHPDALCLDYPHVAALLPNKTIEIHNVETQTIVQVVSPMLPPSPPSTPSAAPLTEPKTLTASLAGFLVSSTQRTDKLRLTPMPVILPCSAQSPTPSGASSSGSDEDGVGGTGPSGSGLTSPPAPHKQLPSPSRPPLFPRANVLLLTENSVQALLPSTLISQAESLLDMHRIEDTIDLADQNQRKLLGNLAVDDDQAEELRYVYQRVGFQCLSETLFEDAGKHLFAGEVDPRILVRYFPDLRGSLLSSTPTLPMYAGVAAHLTPHGSIQDIVATNLVRNYSPHLAPNTREAPPTAELRRILCAEARNMLAAYLRKCRTRRLLDRTGASAGPGAKEMNTVVDTVLVKILAESEETTELYTLIEGPNDVILAEVERPLKKNGQYNALCKLYERVGDEGKLLEAWSQLADGIWTDEDVPEPLSRMIELLNKTTNRALVQHWGIWLTQKDAELGLRLIISRDSKRSSKADDTAMLEHIRKANPVAATQYLEYLVLQKRSSDGALHAQLANSCVDRLMAALSDEHTSKLWRAKAASYGSSPNDTPFMSYFVSTTPDSEHKRIRLKTALFLQGSNLYDVEQALNQLQAHQKLLHLEIAILFGKLGRHEEALATLVHDVHDATSAEAYCTLGGDVVSAKVARSVGERAGLQPWAALVTGVSDARQQSAGDGTKRALLRVLLGVYMRGGGKTAGHSARLLNSQAINLDVEDVIALVPPDWSLSVMSSFLARSFRRTLHTKHEGQILKAISAGQNLEVAEQTWEILREQGAVIEEAGLDDDADDEDCEDEHVDEKGLPASFTEKVGLHDTAASPGVDEIAVSSLPVKVTADQRRGHEPGELLL